jgi:cardiolipin synthase
MLHQKTMVVDDVWVTIGTTNFDNRSFAHNEESNVCVFDRGLGRQLQQTFLDDRAVCECIELAKWRRRGLWARAQELVAWFLEDQV